MKSEEIQIISALVIACTGLIAGLCLGLKQLHIKRCKSKCVDLEMSTSSSEEVKK